MNERTRQKLREIIEVLPSLNPMALNGVMNHIGYYRVPEPLDEDKRRENIELVLELLNDEIQEMICRDIEQLLGEDMSCCLCGSPSDKVACDHCIGMEVASEHLGADPEVGERTYLSVVEDTTEKD